MSPYIRWVVRIISFIFGVGMIELIILTLLSPRQDKEEENEKEANQKP